MNEFWDEKKKWSFLFEFFFLIQIWFYWLLFYCFYDCEDVILILLFLVNPEDIDLDDIDNEEPVNDQEQESKEEKRESSRIYSLFAIDRDNNQCRRTWTIQSTEFHKQCKCLSCAIPTRDGPFLESSILHPTQYATPSLFPVFISHESTTVFLSSTTTNEWILSSSKPYAGTPYQPTHVWESE